MIIVGGSGYIGRRLIEVSAPTGLSYGTSSSHGTDLVHLNLKLPASFDYSLVTPGIIVLLTAAISAPDVCAREYDEAWAVNVTGTSAFVTNAIARGARVVFFSSDTVYGERANEFDEFAASQPVGEYAVMKHEVERRFAGNPSFKAIRLSYVFSREDKLTRYLAECAQRGEEADLYHPFFRAIVHREDVVAGALALAERWYEFPEQVINFGGPQVLSRVEFAECLREVHLRDLRFKVTEPDADFFRNRPRAIAMASPILARLLRRPPRSLCAAARIEFSSPSLTE
jgi:dTDP-4-dehydrorhamnose reductase